MSALPKLERLIVETQEVMHTKNMGMKESEIRASIECGKKLGLVVEYDSDTQFFKLSAKFLGTKKPQVPILCYRGSRKIVRDLARVMNWAKELGFQRVVLDQSL